MASHINLILLSCFAVISFASTVESAKRDGGITVDLIHRDSPRSPSYEPSTTRFQRLRSAINRSFARKSSLALRSLASKNAASLRSPDAIEATIVPGGGEYLLKIGLGTPPVQQLVIADTGSDLLWTQCKPCTQCYKQNFPFFDPSRTSTYKPVSCRSDQCASAGSSTCGPTNGCQYQINYGDRSYSIGDVAVETLTLGSSPRNGSASFRGVVFGCGHQNDGTFRETASGIIGLGGGAVSIIKQLDTAIGGKFSYCLTSLDSNASSTLSFGSDAVVKGRGVVSTPLVAKDPETFYYLTLEAVSVGSKRLDKYKKSRRTNDDDDFGSPPPPPGLEEGNIIIDSGTTLTFVPSDLYAGVRKSLVSSIRGIRVTDPQGTFDLCYRVPSGGAGFAVPPVTAHFTGADVELPQESIFIEVERGIACLTLVPSQDLAIFGNLHQINHRIGYDTVAKVVSFLPTDCSKPQ